MRTVILLLACATLLTAQGTRDPYRAAYQAWRQTDPLLESKAGAPSPEFAAEAQRTAGAAKLFTTARLSFLTA
ncbi:MAG: hypothetical protein ABI995_12325, partial [Acidobacteriota bacterium]